MNFLLLELPIAIRTFLINLSLPILLILVLENLSLKSESFKDKNDFSVGSINSD